MTSDERIEIAERLRTAAKTKSGSADYLWNRLQIAVNGWQFGDVIDESYVFDNDVLARLADLIDPTCRMANTSSCNGLGMWCKYRILASQIHQLLPALRSEGGE